MSREQLVAMAERAFDHRAAGTGSREPAMFEVPVEHYTDPARWQLEEERIFKRLPLVLAFSVELQGAGAYVATEAAGVPVLIVRQADGSVRAFVDMCSHRGAIVVPEGHGSARRFSCPYHGWTYGADGELVGIPDGDAFDGFDRGCHGLTPLRSVERAGLVWVDVDPASTVDFETFIAGYDGLLAHLGLDRCHLVGRQVLRGPNWKLAYDGYLDFYHLPVLHRASFGPGMSNKAIYDAWGPHQRVTAPDTFTPKLVDQATDEWPVHKLTGGIWTIFPHVSIADFGAGGRMFMVSQLFPGATVGESTTVQTFLHTREPDADIMVEVGKQMTFLHGVVQDEDYGTGLGIQRAIASGAKKAFTFGRNEGGGQRFHRWTQALVEIDPGDDRALAALLAEGPPR
jgi:phenylpropionate dioxygenase-like ring-hydroxylating dioxygenase large terminal subunit